VGGCEKREERAREGELRQFSRKAALFPPPDLPPPGGGELAEVRQKYIV